MHTRTEKQNGEKTLEQKVKPAAAALPMACSVDRPLLPSRLLPVPDPAAVPKPSDEDEDEDMD